MNQIEPLTTDIHGCARCGGHHIGVEVFKFKGKPVAGGFDYWTICPKLKEPVIISGIEEKAK